MRRETCRAMTRLHQREEEVGSEEGDELVQGNN